MKVRETGLPGKVRPRSEVSVCRNRTLTEGVESVLNEWQRGGSFMAGAAGTFGGGGWGASAAMGGAYTTSSGTRELAASTVQQIADAYHQASNAADLFQLG